MKRSKPPASLGHQSEVGVSILVLVDEALEDFRGHCCDISRVVSILVLVDEALEGL